MSNYYNRSNRINIKAIQHIARARGIEICVAIDVEKLIPEPRIRQFCYQDRCGCFNKNFMCPNSIGSVEDLTVRLRRYNSGIVLQYCENLLVKDDRIGVEKSKLNFHKNVLTIEKSLADKGITDVWGMIGGNCSICTPCRIVFKEKCPFPRKARTSLEAIGIDVLGLLKSLGLDYRFHSDRITWTGSIFFNNI